MLIHISFFAECVWKLSMLFSFHLSVTFRVKDKIKKKLFYLIAQPGNTNKL